MSMSADDRQNLYEQLRDRLGLPADAGPDTVVALVTREVNRRNAARSAAREAPPAAPVPAPSTRPPFVASGLDPSILDSVAEPVRGALAAAPTPADAYRIVQRYGDVAAEDVIAEAFSHQDVDVMAAAQEWQRNQNGKRR